MRVLRKHRPAHTLPEGFIAFSTFIMQARVHLPLYLFFVRALDYFSIASMQLANIYILYYELGFLKLTMEEVNYMYYLKRVSGPLNRSFGYFYLSGWPLSVLNLINLHISNVGV